MADLGDFDATEVDPNAGYDPMPEGIYQVMITESEVKPTKSGNGSYLQLTMAVTNEEKYNNRKLFERLNLDNPSEEAVAIAKGQLSAICRCVGVPKPGDSSKLHDIPFKVKVKIRKRQDNGELVNEIAGYVLPGTEAAAPQKGGKKDDAGWMK